MVDYQENIENTENCGLLGLSCNTRRYPLGGFLFGLLFPIVSWIFVLVYNDENILNLWHLHKVEPLLFIIDLAPFILGYVAYLLALRIEKKENRIKSYTQVREQYIQKLTDYVKEIGQGNFDAEIEDIDKSDLLYQAIDKMKKDLQESNEKEKQRNWKITGRDKISGVLRQYSDLNELSYYVLKELIQFTELIQGAFYIYEEDEKVLRNYATYAYNRKKFIKQEFKIGEGLIGEAAYEMDVIYRKEIPEDYATITSGILGDKKPGSIFIVPLITDEKLKGVIEVASIQDEIPELVREFIQDISSIIAQSLFSLIVNYKTNLLLKESQKMTMELQENEEELRQNAEEMRATQEELEKVNIELEEQIKAVKNAQLRQYTLLENASEVITIYDEKGIIKYDSPSVKNILGYSYKETVGTQGLDRVAEDYKEKVKEIFKYLINNQGRTVTVEYEYYKQDGSLIWLESYGRNLIDNPIINGILFNTRDITLRKLAEKEQRRRGQMQALSENSPDLIMRISLDGTIYYINPVIKKYTGLQTSDVINKKITESDMPEAVTTFFISSLQVLITNPVKQETEFEFDTEFGKRYMSVNSIPEFNEDNELETVLFVAHDITERKEFEMEIEKSNKKITESINYAKRIQGAILPKGNTLQTHLNDAFIFYKPKDVVSGDFPWMFDKEDNIYFAAVDCTGHGVPGALLSFIGYFLLNNIVDHKEEFLASEVLDKLHFGVRRTLRQDSEGANSRDGMDVALCRYDKQNKQLHYAGAHRPLYLLRNGELTELKGDRKAIGGIPLKKKKEQNFTNHVIDIQEGDKIFIFSDGFPDQVGGEDKKKYQAKQIRKKLVENSNLSMAEFNDLFEKEFYDWKGDYKQIDDILMIGVQF